MQEEGTQTPPPPLESVTTSTHDDNDDEDDMGGGMIGCGSGVCSNQSFSSTEFCGGSSGGGGRVGLLSSTMDDAYSPVPEACMSAGSSPASAFYPNDPTHHHKLQRKQEKQGAKHHNNPTLQHDQLHQDIPMLPHQQNFQVKQALNGVATSSSMMMPGCGPPLFVMGHNNNDNNHDSKNVGATFALSSRGSSSTIGSSLASLETNGTDSSVVLPHPPPPPPPLVVSTTTPEHDAAAIQPHVPSSSVTSQTTTTKTASSSDNNASSNNKTPKTSHRRATGQAGGGGGGRGGKRNTAKGGADGPKISANVNAGPNRRQKRLERNRESARLSRRRRKQYLEVLEERVTQLGQEMDQGRREHVAAAMLEITGKRVDHLDALGRWIGGDNGDQQGSDTTYTRRLLALENELARTSLELRVVSTFQAQQLRSFVMPPGTKFILWLSLQNDTFFRGGRAASERLSAARIGERMLSSGTDRATPIQCMWPLFCHEICLSYEQEEKVRIYQQQILQTGESWLGRHSAVASNETMQSLHDAVQALSLRFGQRERATSRSILSKEQRCAMLSWAHRNRARIAEKVKKNTSHSCSIHSIKNRDPFEMSENQHVAANLYILNHRFQNLLNHQVPRASPLVTGMALKKLLRRPSFESLGAAATAAEKGCGHDRDSPLSRESSFPSCGSLKRSASEMSMDDNSENKPPSQQSVIPLDAQEAAKPLVESILGFLKDIIPPPPPPAVTSTLGSVATAGATPTPVLGMPSPAHQKQQHSVVSSGVLRTAPTNAPFILPAPTPVSSVPLGSVTVQTMMAQAPTGMAVAAPTTIVYTSQAPQQLQPLAPAGPIPIHNQGQGVVAMQQQHQQQQHSLLQDEIDAPGPPETKHARKSSFLPPHLNVVPEEMWPAEADDDILMKMVDEDWAIGEGMGIDMDT